MLASLWATPLLFTLVVLALGFSGGTFLLDFKGGLYDASRQVLAGHNPYSQSVSYLQHAAAVKHAGGKPETVIYLPVYPASAFIAVLPLSVLPYTLAAVLFAVMSIAALMLALRLLGVSDWRCYGLTFASWPVLHGLMLGALTPLLTLLLALVWRYRDRAVRSAAAVAVLISTKLFPWPLVLWLAFTRRLRAAGLAAALSAGLIVCSWALIGFKGMRDYPAMLGHLSFISEGVGVSPVAALIALGLGAEAAKAVSLLAAAGLLIGAWRVRSGEDGERRAFTLTVVALLTASPMVWPHYFALLLVVIALRSRTLSPIWFLALVPGLQPIDQTGHHPWTIAIYVAVLAATAAIGLLPRRTVAWRTERIGTQPS